MIGESRNYGSLLEPTELLCKFGEWIVERVILYLRLSYIKLLPTPVIIQYIYNAYTSNNNFINKLPNCHPVAQFIIKKLATRLISSYCSRSLRKNVYKFNSSLPSAGKIILKFLCST